VVAGALEVQVQFEFEDELEARERTKEKTLLAYQSIFNAADARVVLVDLIRIANVFAPTYRDGNPERTAFEEGMRRIVLRILRLSGIEARMMNQIGGMYGPVE
jgi:hypothetical protein